jgi:hypothetical protein
MEVRGAVENGGITGTTGDYGYEPNGVIGSMAEEGAAKLASGA